jgi:HSP20 family molecular chaperone IbpA
MATQQKGRESRSNAPERTSIERDTANERGRSSLMNRRDTQRDLWMDPIQRFFNAFGLGAAGNRIGDWNMWNPQLETFQRGDELVIRADLPGLKKEDVNVEVTDDAIVISGERRDESVEDREGFYHSERSYGSFYRSIPLPEGTIGDNAKANFKDGVLEITMPAPPREAARGRRIEIGEGTSERTASRAGSRGRPQTENMPPTE